MLISLIQDSFIIKATFHENCQLFKHYIFHIIITYAYKKNQKGRRQGKDFQEGVKIKDEFFIYKNHF